MTRAPNLSRVHHGIAGEARRLALAQQPGQTRARQTGFSHYCVLHYRATGDLAPGCDMKDFAAWWDRETVEGGGG